MEIKRALEIIEEEMPFTSGVIEEAMETIRDVVAKQTPKKVMLSKEYPLYKLCFNCHKNLFSFANGWQYNYCPYCGQALDWGNEND